MSSKVMTEAAVLRADESTDVKTKLEIIKNFIKSALIREYLVKAIRYLILARILYNIRNAIRKDHKKGWKETYGKNTVIIVSRVVGGNLGARLGSAAAGYAQIHPTAGGIIGGITGGYLAGKCAASAYKASLG